MQGDAVFQGERSERGGVFVLPQRRVPAMAPRGEQGRGTVVSCENVGGVSTGEHAVPGCWTLVSAPSHVKPGPTFSEFAKERKRH